MNQLSRLFCQPCTACCFSLLLFLFFNPLLLGQQVIVSGTVVDQSGVAISGAIVEIVETGKGMTTLDNGEFSISALPSQTIRVSSLGYQSVTQQIGSSRSINFTLVAQNQALGEVVVTALGIQKDSRLLSYATQNVKGEQLSTVRETNVMNSLQGKVAGMQVSRNASGAGGSVRVILRGNKSTRDNSPLYVIDGLPISRNLGSQNGGVFGGGRDGGDVLSSLNPDDIESINVLKGASAAALYGSQAANGAIIITTKKGKVGRAAISYSTSLTFDNAFVVPELQNEYGSEAGSKYSWGAKESSDDIAKDFFETGITWINNISLSGGTDKFQTYFSYSNTDAKGIMPGNKYNKHTLMFKESAKIGNRLTIDGNVMLTSQVNDNQPTIGLYFNPLTGLYFFPRSLDFSDYDKDHYEVYSPNRFLNIQNWWNINSDLGLTGDDNQQNPYWVVNRNLTQQITQRIYTALQAKYKISDALSLQVRGNLDKTFYKYERKIYATTQGTLSPSNGRYSVANREKTQYYIDGLLSFDKKFANVSLNVVLGSSYKYNSSAFNDVGSNRANLKFANIFTVQNINTSKSFNMSQGLTKKALAAIFANVQLGIKEYLILDLTARNDWSSSLPGQSFFYPSVGLSAIISEMVDFPKAIDFLKVRASFTSVGNDIPAYANNPLNRINVTTGLVQNTVGPQPGTKLKPELSQSIEIGLESRFFEGVLDFAFTWYQNNTFDQLMYIAAPSGSGFTRYAINAGNIQNAGIEIVLGAHPFFRNEFKWDITLNVSQNTNLVVELSEDLPSERVTLTGPGVNNYGFYITKGSAFGEIHGKKFSRDAQGRIILDKKGKPIGAPGFSKVGNSNPDALIGLTNSFSYKNFTFSFLLDARIGGDVMSMSQAMLGEYGVSQETADARNAGGVEGNFVDADGVAVSKIDADVYYLAVGGRAGITEAFMYDASNVRLRELSLGYTFPAALIQKTKVFQSLSINFIARNLFFFYKDAPYDPEVSMSSGNAFQGVDVFSLPSISSFGFSLSVTL